MSSCSNIAGATASSYKLTSNDVGHTVVVAVTATNAGGSGKASSGATGTVASVGAGGADEHRAAESQWHDRRRPDADGHGRLLDG